MSPSATSRDGDSNTALGWTALTMKEFSHYPTWTFPGAAWGCGAMEGLFQATLCVLWRKNKRQQLRTPNFASGNVAKAGMWAGMVDVELRDGSQEHRWSLRFLPAQTILWYPYVGFDPNELPGSENWGWGLTWHELPVLGEVHLHHEGTWNIHCFPPQTLIITNIIPKAENAPAEELLPAWKTAGPGTSHAPEGKPHCCGHTLQDRGFGSAPWCSWAGGKRCHQPELNSEMSLLLLSVCVPSSWPWVMSLSMPAPQVCLWSWATVSPPSQVTLRTAHHCQQPPAHFMLIALQNWVMHLGHKNIFNSVINSGNISWNNYGQHPQSFLIIPRSPTQTHFRVD